MGKRYACRKIAEGIGKGPAVLSKDAVCFYLVVPETGEVIERNHDLEGRNVAGRVLVAPSGKGSSVVQADGVYKLGKYGNKPVAMIIEHADPVLVSSALIFDVPMVHKVDRTFYADVKEGDEIIVNADEGFVEIV